MNDAELVKVSRLMLGLSQEKMAEGLGCACRTVMCWETGRNAVKPKTFRAVLEMLAGARVKEEAAAVLQDERQEHLKALAAMPAKHAGSDGRAGA